jgi:hypothetical protein
VCVCWLKSWAGKCLRASSGSSWEPWPFVSSESCSSILGAVIMILRPSPDSSLYAVGDKGTGCAEGAICDRNLRPSSLGRDMRSATAGTFPGGEAKLYGEWSP